MDETIKTVLTADDSEHRAAFERAAGQVKSYQGKVEDMRKATLARATQDLKALKLEASGQREAAQALRESISLKERAIALAKQTGLSEQAALVLLQKRLALEQQVASQRARAGAPVSLSGMPVGDLAQMDRWNRVAAEAQRRNERFGRSGANAAMGVLELSRAVEDAQYGLRGVINNVPGMVMAFGGTAGIAGAVSLAAVAFYQLGKAYMAFYDSIGNDDAVKAGIAAREEEYKAQRKQLDALKQEERIRASVNRLERDYAEVIDRSLSMQQNYADVIERQLDLRAEQHRMTDELAAAEERLAKARGGSTGGNTGAEVARLREELVARKKQLELINQEFDRQDTSNANILTGADSGIEANTERIRVLREELVHAEAEAKGAAAALAKMGGRVSGSTNAARDVKLTEQARAARAAELADLEAKTEALKRQRDAAAAAGKAGKDEIEARLAATSEEVRRLKEAIPHKERLLELERQITAAAEERRKNDELRVRRDDLWEARTADMIRQAPDLPDEEKEKRKQEARQDFLVERAALTLEARGHAARAEALRNEHRLRREAADQAERMGITEAQALRLLREREQQEKAITRHREGAERGRSRIARAQSEDSRIRQSAQNLFRWKRLDSTGFTQGAMGRWGNRLNGARGLRESELERRGRARQMGAKTGEADVAKKYYADSIEIMERQLKVWENLQAK